MPYNTDLARVKDLLENPSGVDEELGRDLDAAYGEVRDLLNRGGFDVPLSDASESIKEAEALLAASKFKMRRHSDSELKTSQLYRAEGERIIIGYMNVNAALPIVIGEVDT